MSKINYSKGKVYKIWSTQGDKIYIGATTKDYLSQRMQKHRESYLQWKKEKGSYIRSYDLFEEYGIENCFIELLEAKECKNKDELNQLEGHYIRTLICVNKIIPNRDMKEWNEYYYLKNIDQIKKQRKEYYEINKDHIKEYKKLYNEKNKEKRKEYREINKEKIKEKKTLKFICECGLTLCYNHKARHLRTKKHENLMKNIK